MYVLYVSYSRVFCRENMAAVDEYGRALGWRNEAPAHCDPKDTSTEECRMVPHIKQEGKITTDYIALFHYATKSREDFERKLDRAKDRGFSRDWDFFNDIDRCALLTYKHAHSR
jgi:hypothetical protein